jgi:hypothetical protein
MDNAESFWRHDRTARSNAGFDAADAPCAAREIERQSAIDGACALLSRLRTELTWVKHSAGYQSPLIREIDDALATLQAAHAAV